MSLRIPDRPVEAPAGIRAGEQVRPTSGLAPVRAGFLAPGHMFITDHPYNDFDCQEEGHVDP